MKRIGLYLSFIALFLTACNAPSTLKLHQPRGVVQEVNNGHESTPWHFAGGLLSIQCSASATQDVGTYPMWQHLYATNTNKVLVYGNPSTEKFEIVIRDLQDVQILRVSYPPVGSTDDATKARTLIGDNLLKQFEDDLKKMSEKWDTIKADYYCTTP